MSDIRTYLLSVLSASVICAMLNHFFKEKNGICAVIRFLAGIFLTVTVVRPVFSLSVTSALQGIDNFSAEASVIAQEGSAQAEEAMESFIKEQTEAYILKEATRLQTDISVEVRLSEDNPPLPIEVTVYGAISPYAKSYLSHMITEDIGISKECQLWMD